MAGRAHGADLRICATVAVEGRTRLVPLAPGTVSTVAAARVASGRPGGSEGR